MTEVAETSEGKSTNGKGKGPVKIRRPFSVSKKATVTSPVLNSSAPLDGIPGGPPDSTLPNHAEQQGSSEPSSSTTFSFKRVQIVRPTHRPLPPQLPPAAPLDRPSPAPNGDSASDKPETDELAPPPSKKRKKTKKNKSKFRAPELIQEEDDALFFLDVGDAPDPLTLPPSDALPQTTTSEDAPTTVAEEPGPPPLLLPAHVFMANFVSENVGNESLDAETFAPASAMDTSIQFVDDDTRPTIRYFETDQPKLKGRLCSICGEPGHIARACKVLVCWTCGARDEHESRDCPVNITCWNCGRRGHASAKCPEPRARRVCDLCGSFQHVQNSCPSLWRRYTHYSAYQRETALEHRASKIGLKLGEGGEGFIAWDAECFTCGEIGHWGFDCSLLSRHLMQKEPPAFSRHHADNPHLPWPFDAHNRDGQHRFVHAVRALAEASETAATDSQDMEAIEPKAWAAGRNAKEKARKRAREVEEDQVEDEEDWFARSTSGGGGGRGGSKRGEKRPEQSNSSRRNGADKSRKKHGSSKAQDEVAAWFDTGRAGASASNSGSGKKGQSSKSRSQPQSSRERDRDRETQDEREEREYLEYQTRNGGRYDEAEDHSVRSRSHGGRRDDDHGNGRDRNRDRDRDRDRDTHASWNRSPDHRGGRDRRESRTQPRSHFTASFGFDSEADGPSTNGPRVPSTTTTATEKTAGSVPNLSISIRGASGASKGGGGKQGLLAKRLGPTQASEANDQGASGGSRENGEGGKFRPKWRGGYGR